MQNCKLDSLRGYSYKLPNSIINCHHIYPNSILMTLANALQLFDGIKSNIIFSAKRQINAIELSGRTICIGEKAMAGQLISVILLNIDHLDEPRIFNYQKTRINFVSLSLDGEFLCSIGSSSDDVQQLNLIEVNNQAQIGTRIFFSKTFKKKDGKVKCLRFSNKDPLFFVVQFTNKIIFYRIDKQIEGVEEQIAKTSKVRQYNNFIFSPSGLSLYGCSQNGDIAQISIEEGREIRIGPKRRVITKGITNVRYIDSGLIAITGKEGLVALINAEDMKLLKEVKLQDQQVVSFSQFNGDFAYIATNKAVIYRFDANTCDTEIIYTCHSKKINQVAMIKDFEGIFGTCSGGQIVIWQTKSLNPIIKIYVPKVTCESLCFPKSGRMILSGWSDDIIRIFSPKDGKLMRKIAPANLSKPTKIIADDDSTKMICGGDNGVIRLWNIFQNKNFCMTIGCLAYHYKRIHDLAINPYNQDMLGSCSQDGQFAIWSLKRFELLKHFKIANFLKQLSFLSSNKIRVWGAGNKFIQCLLNDGTITKQIQASGTCINTANQCFIPQTSQTLMIFAGDQNCLCCFDMEATQYQIAKLPSYGEINQIVVSHDKKNVIAVTDNGVVICYRLFAIKKRNIDDY